MQRSSRVRGNRSRKERAVSTEPGGLGGWWLGSGLEIAEPLTGGQAERSLGRHWGHDLGTVAWPAGVEPPASEWPGRSAEAAVGLEALPPLSKLPPP